MKHISPSWAADLRRRLTHLLVPVGLVAGLITVGCAVADEANVRDPSNNGQLAPCLTTADCYGGALCVADVCVPPGTEAPRQFSLELAPPEVSGYARTQRLDATLDSLLASEALTLPVPNEYETVVLSADNAPVSARITLFGDRRIVGREVDVNVSIAANTPQRPTFRLLEGDYLVRIRPTSAELPGMEIKRFTVRAQPGPSVKEFKLPASYRRLHGQVTSSLSGSDKIAGVTVRAFAEKSGLPSTISVTDADGNYELLLPASEDTTFRLYATPPAAAQPAWGFEQVVGVDLDQDRRRPIHLEPTDDSIRGRGRFQILGTTADGRLGAPVPNAFVSLTATVSGVIEPPVYAITGLTDADGVMVVDFQDEVTTQVPLLKARYVVQVVPPVNTPYTSRTMVLDLTSARYGFVQDEQITLPQRTRLRGSVVSRLGRPVVGAFLELRPLSADVRPADTITAGDGTFTVDLDPGRYLMVARPRGASDAAELLPVSARTLDVSASPGMDLAPFTLHLGQKVQGQVLGGRDGAPVPLTQAELFFTVEGQVVSLGRAETDGAGWFSLVVPVGSP